MKNSPEKISSVSLFLSVDAQTWVMNRIFHSKSGFVESPHPYLPNQKSFWKVVAPKVSKKLYGVTHNSHNHVNSHNNSNSHTFFWPHENVSIMSGNSLKKI